jgi:hypothetical protein
MGSWYPGPALWALGAACGLLLFGYLVVTAATRPLGLDGVVRWALAFPALVAFSLVLMLVHIASRGRVFSHPLVVRAAAGVAAATALALAPRRSRGTLDRPSAAAVGLLLVGGLIVWQTPVARMVPLAPARSDFDWHMGWAAQLMHGHTTPTSLLPGPVPNYYPWLYHALVAVLAAFCRTWRPYDALPTLQLLQVAGAVLALFALGREVGGNARSGVLLAVLGALAGGFGFFLTRRPSIVIDPRGPGATRFLGDLLFVRSYNGAFQDLSPPFPRDVAYALLAAFLLLLALGIRRGRLPVLAGAGVVLGLVALTGAEAAFVGVGVGLIVGSAQGSLRRAAALATIFLPAAGLYMVWLVPLAVSYLRLGGFVDTSIGTTVVLPAWAVLGAWGVATPLALVGAVPTVRRAIRDPAARLPLASVAVPGGLLLLSLLPGGGPRGGFASLGRSHRYWPLLYLGVALLGATGASGLEERVRRVVVRAPVALLVLALAVPSPLLASLALPGEVRTASLVREALLGRPDSILESLRGQSVRATCTVAAPPALALTMFGYTGDAFVAVRTFGRRQNFARIRWRNIYRLIPGDAPRLAANQVLITGEGPPGRWRAVAARWGVDLVVAPSTRLGAPGFAGLDVLDVDRRAGLALIRVRACRPGSSGP